MALEPGWYKLRNSETEIDALAGAHYDLWVVEDMLAHCLDTSGDLHKTCEELEEACWTAAIVRYERAFNGLPSSLHQSILTGLSQTQVESHHFFRYLRDKMFAHRTGIGDDLKARAAVFPLPGGEVGLVTVAPRASRISSLGTDMASEFYALVVTVRAIVMPLLERKKREATRRLQSRPLSEVVKGTPLALPELTPKKDDLEFMQYLARALRHS